MQSTITLKVRENMFYAVYQGDHAAKIIDLFGGDTLPTPYGKNTPAATVKAKIAALNPGVRVRLETDAPALWDCAEA